MTEPRVSIIVPVYNAERALPRLMASLRAQSYPRWRVQVLMVDNGSTDASREMMARYPEVTVLSQTERQGPAATRNEGIRRAEGEVLAFIDADCWAGADWLRTGVHTLRERGADRVAGRVEFVLSDHPNFYEMYDSTINFQQGDFIAGGWSGTGNLFARREVFDAVGLFDPDLVSCEDSEWGRRATAAGKTLVYADAAVVYHKARRAFWPLMRKWMRTEYGAAQVYRRRGELALQLWYHKANWRPLAGAWRRFPPERRRSARVRCQIDLMANALRLAGNAGSFMGYFGIGRPVK